MIEPPPPPTSFGQEKPTQRFSRTLRSTPSGTRRPRLASRQVLVEERADLVAEGLFFFGELKIHLETSQARDALVVIVRVAEHGPHPLRALQVELDVVFPGVSDAAVELNAHRCRLREGVARSTPSPATPRARVLGSWSIAHAA